MPPQHDKRQTLMVAVLWMILMAMPSMADEGGQDADNGEQVFTELVAGTRPVLLFTKAPDHSLLVVGSSGATMATTKLEDTYVFKVASSSTSVLLKEMQKIKSAWAKLTGPYTAMFAVGESIVLVDGSGASVLDTKSGTISQMTLNKNDKQILQANWLLSSSKTPTFYYITPTDKSMFSRTFNSPNLAQATQIALSSVQYLCNAGQDQILIQSASCKQNSVSWTIIAGYVDDTDFLLVEQQSNSIIRFSRATFDHPNGSPVSLQRIAANQFWRYSKPTAPPTAEHDDLPSTTDSSNLGIIIAVVCVVLLLLIIVAVAVAVYCIYFKKKQKKPSSKGLKVTSSDGIGKAADSSVSKKAAPSGDGRSQKKHSAAQQSSRNTVNTKRTKGQANKKAGAASSKGKVSSAKKRTTSARGARSSSKRGASSKRVAK